MIINELDIRYSNYIMIYEFKSRMVTVIYDFFSNGLVLDGYLCILKLIYEVKWLNKQ